jgi:hypothetical protein
VFAYNGGPGPDPSGNGSIMVNGVTRDLAEYGTPTAADRREMQRWMDSGSLRLEFTDDREWVTVGKAADLMGISEEEVRELARTGALSCKVEHFPGGQELLVEPAVVTFVGAKRPDGASPSPSGGSGRSGGRPRSV